MRAPPLVTYLSRVRLWRSAGVRRPPTSGQPGLMEPRSGETVGAGGHRSAPSPGRHRERRASDLITPRRARTRAPVRVLDRSSGRGHPYRGDVGLERTWARDRGCTRDVFAGRGFTLGRPNVHGGPRTPAVSAVSRCSGSSSAPTSRGPCNSGLAAGGWARLASRQGTSSSTRRALSSNRDIFRVRGERRQRDPARHTAACTGATRAGRSDSRQQPT